MFTNHTADDPQDRYEPEIEPPRPHRPFRPLIPSGKSDPFEFIADARRGVASLHESRSMFHLKTVLDDHDPRALTRGRIAFLEFWPSPPWYTGRPGGGNGRQYVSPLSADAHRYADVCVQCGCGEVITDYAPESHTDSCGSQMRRIAHDRLTERRREAAICLLRHGWTLSSIGVRFGVPSGSPRLHTYGIDVDAERGVFYEKVALSLVEADGSVTPRDAARALDVDRHKIADALHDAVGKREAARLVAGVS